MSDRDPVYVFEGFRLDARRRVLFGADGQPIPLTSRLFDTLLYLVERQGELVTKEKLLEAIWPHAVVEEQSLGKAISALRKALGEKPEEHRFIVTKHGLGYRFVAQVSVAADKEPSAEVASLDGAGARHDAVTMAGSESAAGGAEGLVQRSGDVRRYWAGAALGATGLLIGAALLGFLRSAPEAQLRVTPLSFEQGGQGAPVWSPDGRAIAYGASQRRTEPWQLHVRYLDAPIATRLAERALPRQWTTRGQILFGSPGPPAGLWSISPVGGTPELVHPSFERSRGNLHSFAITRDGTAVAGVFQQDDGTIALGISWPLGAPLTRYEPPLTAQGFVNVPFVEFSPDGKQIVLVWNPNGAGEQVWLMPFPGDAARPPRRVLENLPMVGGAPQFSWMPDNRHIVVSTTDGDSPAHLYLADTQSGRFRLLSRGTAAQRLPAVSPDGSKLVFVENRLDFDVVSLDLTNAAITPLVATDRNEDMPAWALRADALVYVTDRNGGPEIWLHEPGRMDRPIVTSRDFPTATQFFMGPTLSPDGKRVMFHRLERDYKTAGLWMASVDGGAPQSLTNEPVFPSPASWSPDGTSYVFLAGVDTGGYSLLRARTTGQAPPDVLATDVAQPQSFGNDGFVPTWSPSGEWILYVDRETKLISADGSTSRDLGIGKAFCAFARDADVERLYCVRTEGYGPGSVFEVDFNGENLRAIGSIPNERTPRSSLTPGLRLTLAPDGKSVTYGTAPPASGHLWLMEGLETVPLP